MQMWALLVRCDKLEKFHEGHDTLLSRDLCVTYRARHDPVACPVGKDAGSGGSASQLMRAV